MVEGLSKHIAGDWADLSRCALSLESLASFFGLDPAALVAIARELEHTVEAGAAEYKEALVVPFFAALEEMKWKTVGSGELGRQRGELGKAVFLAMAQRLVASGALTAAVDTAADKSADDQVDLKLILSDVMARVRDDPSLKTDQAVKLILTQLAIYQRERETMEKLMPNIKDPEKATAFRRNFRNTFEKISVNIGKHYADFKDAERRRLAGPVALSLAALPLKELVPFFTREAREFLRLRSTLAFALEGKYKVREMCVRLHNEKQAMLGLLAEEKAAILRLAADKPAGAQRLHQTVAAVISAGLAKLVPG
jgi:hypothetical protein